MMDITLTCRLFREIEENTKEFSIKINNSKFVYDLKKLIKEEKKDIFSNTEVDNLELWGVEIHNDNADKFSSLILQDNKSKDIKKLETIKLVSDYWENQPSANFTHIIVDSKFLTMLRSFNQTTLNQGRSTYH